MKTNKKSLLAAIAILAVCAMALTTSAYAWFTSVNQATVSNVQIGVQAGSDLRIAIDPDALSNTAGSLWGISFTGDQIDDVQTTYVDNGAINDAYYLLASNAWIKPHDRTKLDSNGVYNENGTKIEPAAASDANWDSASAPSDFAKFTVYFRSTESSKPIKMAGNLTTSTTSNLAPAVTLKVFEGTTPKFTTYASESAFSNAVICTTTSTADANGYYTAQADFYIYVDGENAATINANARTLVNFMLQTLTFSQDV